MSVLSFSVAPNTPARTRSRREQSRRLDDLRVVGSEYGAPIPVSVGTVRLAGQMIWATELREVSVRNTDTSTARVSGGGGKGKGGKSGGGGGSASLASVWSAYRYYADFAVSFSAGVAKSVIRLWADGSLIFDGTGDQEIMSSLKLRFRFYPGDETQEPDALIESSVAGGQAPAHRGLCYLVFEDLELTDFGNRIPSITAEIAFEESVARPYRTATFLDPSDISTMGQVINPETGQLYTVTAHDGLRVFETTTLHETLHWTKEDLGLERLDKAWAWGAGGVVYAVGGATGYRIDANAGTVLSSGPIEATRGMAAIQVINPRKGKLEEYIVTEPIIGRGVRVFEPDFGAYVTVEPPTGSGWNIYSSHVVPGAVYPWGSTFYWTSQTTFGSTGSIYKGTIFNGLPGSGPFPAGTEPLGTGSVKVAVEEIRRLGVGNSLLREYYGDPTCPEEMGGAAGLIYDVTDHSLIFSVNAGYNGGERHWIKYSETDGIVWAVVGGYPGGSRITQNNLLRREFVSDISGSFGFVTVRSTGDGSLIRHETDWPTAAFRTGVQGEITLEGEANALYTCDNAGPAKIYLGRAAPASSGLGSAVANIAARAGLTGDRIDVSNLVGEVPGYSVADPDLTVRDILEPLMAAYRFDAVESDFKVKFVHLTDRAPVLGLTVSEEASDLLWLDEREGLFLEERRRAESELPQTVSLSYYDPARDYLQGEQHAQRPLYPTLFAQSENRLKIDLPLAITAEQALASAWHILLDAWVGRATCRFRADYGFLALDPLDVVQITLAGRGRHLLRLNSADFSDGLTLEFTGEAVVAPTYQTVFDGDSLAPDFLSDAPPTVIAPSVADSGSGLLSSEVPNRLSDPGATWLFLLDCPLLSDLHGLGGRSVLYYAGVPANPSRPWGGATVGFTRDGETFQQFGRLSAVCGYGAIIGPPPGAPVDPFMTDRQTTITVRMVQRDDALESVSTLAMLNGANPAAILDRDGTVELIHYQTVTENDDGSFTLSNLLRGRRGTEWACGLHGSGARLILLDGDWISSGAVPLDDVGVSLSWGALSDGQAPLSVSTQGHTHRARDLMPYAPAHLNAVVGSDAITLSWVRRTRIGGALKDGTGSVPVSEATEEYEVDILDGPGGTVVRTLTGLTAPTANYTFAQSLEDLDYGATWADVALQNPGAESGGSSVGWTDVLRTFVQSSREHTGARSFAPQDNSGTAEAWQDIALPDAAWEALSDADRIKVRLTWWQDQWSGTFNWGTMGLAFYDGAAVLLATHMADEVVMTDWTERTVEVRAPVGTRTIRVIMRGNDAARFDDAELAIRQIYDHAPALTFRVHQISDAVGRGFPAEATIPLE